MCLNSLPVDLRNHAFRHEKRRKIVEIQKNLVAVTGKQPDTSRGEQSVSAGEQTSLSTNAHLRRRLTSRWLAGSGSRRSLPKTHRVGQGEQVAPAASLCCKACCLAKARRRTTRANLVSDLLLHHKGVVHCHRKR